MLERLKVSKWDSDEDVKHELTSYTRRQIRIDPDFEPNLDEPYAPPLDTSDIDELLVS